MHLSCRIDLIVTGKLETLIQRCLRVIDQCHGDTGLLGSHQSYSQSLNSFSALSSQHLEKFMCMRNIAYHLTSSNHA